MKTFKLKTYHVLLLFFLTLQVFAQSELLKPNMDNALETAWQNKKVLNKQLIDNCDDLTNWKKGDRTKISLNRNIVKEGNYSIKFDATVNFSGSSEGYPTCLVKKVCDNENWQEFNRISVWIYAEIDNAEFAYLSMDIKNEGKEKVPNIYKKKGRHFFKVETNKWNNILWEIPELPRDKITALAFVYTIKGKAFKGIGDTASFYIDKLELQNVDADYEEGWQVAPGKIAYSHTGYLINGPKTALASGLKETQFSILDFNSKQNIYTEKIETVDSRFGKFQKIDFSSICEEGKYQIKIGDIISKPFTISNDIWDESIYKNINFWQAERCGQTVFGIHDNCHRDVCVEHDSTKIVINGGWHDAGDLTQMLYNTGDAVYAMLYAATKLEGKDDVLYSQLINEARWGLDWVLKTRFGKGYRHNFGGLNKYTDGIIGTADDIVFKAKNQAYENFLSALTISKAALFFKNSDIALAEECKQAAIEDWEYATNTITKLNVELCGTATIASANLFKLTNDSLYINKAIEWADILVKSQRKNYPKWDVPLIGFFYKDTDKQQVLRYNPIGMDHAPIVALNSLCELLPDHKDWINWYSTISLYADYIKETAKISNPFEMIPQSIYNVEEIHTPSIYGFQQSTLAKYSQYEEKEPQYKKQVRNGLPLGEGNYLRTFPVWYAHRGSAGIQIAQAIGLAVASKLRNDKEGIDLAQKQLEWMVGRNPFAQSTIYGEGYDFAPFYFVSSGPIVGAMACGIQTDGNKDIPNFPSSAAYTFKEVWTHTAARYLWLVSEVSDLKNIDGNFSSIKNMEKVDLGNNKYQIKVTISEGKEDSIELLGFNLQIEYPLVKVNRSENKTKTFTWDVKIISQNKPWIAVAKIENEFYEINGF